jgi:hypothetical protein
MMMKTNQKKMMTMITPSDIIAVVEAASKKIEQLKIEIADLRKRQLCGHPKACIIYTDEGTHYCAWCENVAFHIQDGERRFQEEHALRKKAEGEVEQLRIELGIDEER